MMSVIINQNKDLMERVSKLEEKMRKKSKEGTVVPNDVRVGIWKHFHVPCFLSNSYVVSTHIVRSFSFQ